MSIIRNERGSAYIITFAFILFFFVIINGLIVSTASLRQSSDTELMRIHMKYRLESAAVIATNKMRSGFAWNTPLTGNIEGFSFTVARISETSSSITLSVTVSKYHNKIDYRRTVTLKIDKATLNIVGWTRP